MLVHRHTDFSAVENVENVVFDTEAQDEDDEQGESSTMSNRTVIESVDSLCQDLCEKNIPFGGKIVIFAGDFRQTLPVIKRGLLCDQIVACVKSSYL